jgi:hypothetical protein
MKIVKSTLANVKEFRFLTASDTDGGGSDSGGDENGSGNEGSSGADEGGSGGGNEGVVAVAVVSKASAMMKTKMTMVRVSVVIGEAATTLRLMLVHEKVGSVQLSQMVASYCVTVKPENLNKT